ncbi:hypothetical protein D3C72_1424390 [compost metagenome]
MEYSASGYVQSSPATPYEHALALRLQTGCLAENLIQKLEKLYPSHSLLPHYFIINLGLLNFHVQLYSLKVIDELKAGGIVLNLCQVNKDSCQLDTVRVIFNVHQGINFGLSSVLISFGMF